MKVIIAGSRGIIDPTAISAAVLASGFNVLEIVSGGARGVDKLGEEYAKEHSLGVKIFPADWEKLKKSAGYVRNVEMSKYADALIAIWDMSSNGTKHMINIMRDAGKPTFVYCVKEHHPSTDGVDHINIYTKAKTELGRALTNISNYGLSHPKYGYFSSMEGYWYWLSTGKQHEEFRNLPAMKCKLTGRKMAKVYYPEFEQDILDGLRLKLLANPEILNSLVNCKLPLVHYYYYGQEDNCKIIIPEGPKFITNYYERIRQGVLNVR